MSIEIIQEMKAITLFAIFFLIYVASAARPFQAGGQLSSNTSEAKSKPLWKNPKLLKILSGTKQVVSGMKYDLKVELDVQRVGQMGCPAIATGKGVYQLVIYEPPSGGEAEVKLHLFTPSH